MFILFFMVKISTAFTLLRANLQLRPEALPLVYKDGFNQKLFTENKLINNLCQKDVLPRIHHSKCFCVKTQNIGT